ncbi:hypothetical protein CDAR_179621, partial [Caerostris darwini]
FVLDIRICLSYL